MYKIIQSFLLFILLIVSVNFSQPYKLKIAINNFKIEGIDKSSASMISNKIHSRNGTRCID